MDVICVIPARYKSTRFPGKPLADINGDPLIQHVWNKCFDFTGDSNKIIVATDDDRIFKVCKDRGMLCEMTSPDCMTGTDRVAELAISMGIDTIVNVQGDEPLIDPRDIELVASEAKYYDICCGMCDILHEDDFRSPSIIKIVTTIDNKLMYASRSPIPTNKNFDFISAKKQVCIYGFSLSALKDFYKQSNKTHFEGIEDIEILRFLELGYSVQMVNVSNSSISVDSPEDLQRVKNALSI